MLKSRLRIHLSLVLLLELATYMPMRGQARVAEAHIQHSGLADCYDGQGRLHLYANSLSGWTGYTNTGSPVSGYVIELWTKNWRQKVRQTTTNERGKFQFPAVADGTYYLKIRKKGWTSLKAIVHVQRTLARDIGFVVEAI